VTVAGIAVAVVSAVVNALALVLQASEARASPSGEGMRTSLLRRLARRPRWLAGTALVVAAGGLQVLALSLAPITVVQPTLATGQLVLLALARLKLGERVGRSEMLGAAAIVVGLTLVVASAPSHTIVRAGASRLLAPLLVVGLPAAATFVLGRLRPSLGLVLVVGAGLSYSWADFVTKLVADDFASSRWAVGAAWIAGLVGFGALAFLEENTALARRPAVTVAPVIGAMKVPLPVLMALWTGIEAWGPDALELTGLLTGLALVASGAGDLARSSTVTRVWAASAPSP